MYCFLIYSSSLARDGYQSYEFGFATKFFRLVGDRPFGRGDVVEILSYKQRTPSEFRIDVRVLGDPRIRGREELDESQRVELPTLLFLSSRIYLSSYSDYQIVDKVSAEVLSFQGVEQDQNKVYAVATLVTGINCKIVAKEPTTGVRFEWVISSKNDLERIGSI